MIPRKIEVATKGFFGSINNPPENIVPAYFHGFFLAGDIEDGIGPEAVVEMEDGVVDTYVPEKIRFIDRPPADQKPKGE
jgi:hypothetical protein